MSVEHPLFLLAAMAVALAFIRPLFRYFFRDWSQLIEDAYLADPTDRKLSVIFGLFGAQFSSAHFQLNLIGFLLSLGIVVGAVYNLLALVAQWLR